MTNPESIDLLAGIKAQHDGASEAIAVALQILNDGYTTDQEANAEAIAQGIGAAVTEATTPLEAHIATLTSAATEDEATIAMLRKDVTDATTALEAARVAHEAYVEAHP